MLKAFSPIHLIAASNFDFDSECESCNDLSNINAAISSCKNLQFWTELNENQ